MRLSLALLLGVSLTAMVACGDDGGGGGGGDDGGNNNDDAGPIDARPLDDAGNVVPGSLHFYGTHAGGIDRVEIAIDPQSPADIGAGDFTLDFWIRLPPAGVAALPMTCSPGKDNWRAGAVLIDRDDSAASADHGDYGIGVFRSGVAFGVSQGTTGTGLCGIIPVTTSGWHHIAATRSASTGVIALYVDGNPDGTNNGPSGDISYRDGTTGAPKDPFLVIGSEKHDTAGLKSIEAFVDELRISDTVRYTAMFTPETMPYTADANTLALYHFDDGDGVVLSDVKGTSPGAVRMGDTPSGTVPLWTTAEPFLH